MRHMLQEGLEARFSPHSSLAEYCYYHHLTEVETEAQAK